MANIDATFQRNCADFVSHHVYGCVSMLVADLARLAANASGVACKTHTSTSKIPAAGSAASTSAPLANRWGVSFEKSLDGSKWNWVRRAGETGWRTAYDALEDMASRPWFESQTGYSGAGELLQDWINSEIAEPDNFSPDELADMHVVEVAAARGLRITQPRDEGGVFRWDFFDGPYDEDYNLEDVIEKAYATISEEITDTEEFENEAYEHWAVSDRLACKLREHGEETFELDGLTVWKRCTTGQAISIDGVIERIFQEEHEDA